MQKTNQNFLPLFAGDFFHVAVLFQQLGKKLTFQLNGVLDLSVGVDLIDNHFV
jgi:hypothetical protein